MEPAYLLNFLPAVGAFILTDRILAKKFTGSWTGRANSEKARKKRKAWIESTVESLERRLP